MFFKKSLKYIAKNKVKQLPNIFSLVLLITIMMIPLSKFLLFWLYMPFFFVFGFRALANAERNDLPWKYKSFIVFTLPFLVWILFIAIIIIFNALTGINPFLGK
jgi:uncharacterized membrane-anchored protein